jgi:hypothetical protein
VVTLPNVAPAQETLSIHKRPSGGRGEYELVGRQGDTTATDLWDHPFDLETPWGVKDANSYVGNQGGKRRFRLMQDKREGHIAPQLAAMLLMPRPTRAESAISRALPVLLDKRYILDIDVHLSQFRGDTAVLRPTVLVTRSGELREEHLKERIDFGVRAGQVQQLHAAARELPTALGALVERHRELVTTRNPIDASVTAVVMEIMAGLDWYDEVYLPGADPLGPLLLLAGVSHQDIDIPEPPDTPDDAPEVRLRAEHIYRLRRERGASAAAFRAKVQSAYDYRCVFCGLRAPSVPNRMQSGVDAAHILPWGNYDLDVVPNGLMLCKQHHWAFDNRVLRLDHTSGAYEVTFVDDAYALLVTDERTIGLLAATTGRIPEGRLPGRPSLRPSPTFIDEFNSLMD